MLKVFPTVGWVALRTKLEAEFDGAGDVAFVFRSSPLGSISHSHANNNDFILHVGGRVMAMPSGFYGGARLGYGGEHTPTGCGIRSHTTASRSPTRGRSCARRSRRAP